MVSHVLERDIEDQLQLELVRRGHLCLKLRTPGFNGIPDRLCLLQDGRTVFVELKRPGERPEMHQIRCHNLLRSLGFKVVVIDTMAGVDRFIREHLTQ